MRTLDIETLRRWDIDHVWHPFTHQAEWAQTNPLVIARGEGVELIDTEGKRYLDASSSLWCNIHGHAHPAINRAIHEQVERIAHSTLLGLTHQPAIELARRLVELAPGGGALSRVFFSDSGATAVEIALKMAFQFWRQTEPAEPGRTTFLAFSGAYHGDTLGAVSVGGVDRFHAMFAPLLFRSLKAPAPHCSRCPLGLKRESCGIACLDEVAALMDERPGEIAAVVVEPLVQAAAGMIAQPEGWLSGLAKLCRDRDILLIADEVAVGFGRTGTMFACEQERVVPDFLCLAKGITGGYLPLAATLATERVHSAFIGSHQDPKTFYHGHTYTGNPVAAAAALASLDVFERDQTLAGLPVKIEAIRDGLARIAGLPHAGEIRGRGLMAGIELLRDPETGAPYAPSDRMGAKVCSKAREAGVLARPLADVVVVMPPLVATEEQIHTIMRVLYESIEATTGP